MRVTNTASDLMAILTNKGKRDEEDDGAKESDFMSILQQALKGHATSIITPSNSEPSFSRISGNQASSENPYYINQTDGYKKFRELVINDHFEFTEDMISIDVNGKTYVNQKGYDFMYKRRVDAAKPILPSSVNEATAKYDAGRENIENYLITMYENYDIKARTNLYNLYLPFGTQQWGMQWFQDDASEQNFFKLIRSSDGQEVIAMMEERNFYGAISNFAKDNSTFAKEYDYDPEGTIDKYYREIAQYMENDKEMPRVDTRTQIPGFYSNVDGSPIPR